MIGLGIGINCIFGYGSRWLWRTGTVNLMPKIYQVSMFIACLCIRIRRCKKLKREKLLRSLLLSTTADLTSSDMLVDTSVGLQ